MARQRYADRLFRVWRPSHQQEDQSGRSITAQLPDYLSAKLYAEASIIFIGTDPEIGCVYKRSGEWRSIVHIFHDEDKRHAIGLDGQRTTASLELRPGIHESAESVVHRLATLVNLMREYYHPPVVAYRCGAWVDPEPLGGHIHLSWDNEVAPTEQTIRRLLSGLNVIQHRLVMEMFDTGQLAIRRNHAARNGRDYGKLGVFRAVPHAQGTFAHVVRQRHIEYRYPPSWMLTPEMAYTFLASAEIVAKLVLVEGYTGPWRAVARDIFDEGTRLPEPGAPSVKQAYLLAKRHLRWTDDLTDHWLP